MRLLCLWGLVLFSTQICAKYDDGARYAFSASAQQSAVFIIDLRNRTLNEKITLTTAPDLVLASQGLKALIVAHQNEKRLTLVDLSSDELVQIPYPLSITPNKLTVSPIGETVAIYDAAAAVLEIHALKRKTVLLRVENVRTNNDFTFNLDGSVIFWTDQTSGELRSSDLWSRQNSVKLARDGSGLSALSRSTDGRLGFISAADRNVVIVLDLAALNIIQEVPVGAGPGRPWGTADGQIMLVPNRKDGTVTAISTGSLQERYTIAATPKPVSLNSGWLDTVTAIVDESGSIIFIETATGRKISSHNVGKLAKEGVVTADSKTLAVASASGMSFFDMRDSSLLGSIDKLPGDASKATLAISNNLCH